MPSSVGRQNAGFHPCLVVAAASELKVKKNRQHLSGTVFRVEGFAAGRR
jgi:hypothetical protein